MQNKKNVSRLVIEDQVTISQLTANWGAVLQQCRDRGPITVTKRGAPQYLITAVPMEDRS